MSQKTRCAYCFGKCDSATAVSWNCNTSQPSKVVSLLWPLKTEEGCHQSMWNTLVKPFRSDCDMTRFQAYQTLIYIMWALRFTSIYLFPEFRKMYSQHFELLCVQSNIAELCMYIVLKLHLSCAFISRREAVCMLDSDTTSKPGVWCVLLEHRLQIK